MAASSSQQTLQLPDKTGPIYLYTLYYRTDGPHPQLVSFYLPSKDMKFVVERAKRFCETMRYRFVHVKPAIIDLDAEEERHLQRD